MGIQLIGALVPVEAVGDTVEPARVPVVSFLLCTVPDLLCLQSQGNCEG